MGLIAISKSASTRKSGLPAGAVLDELIANPRRLGIANGCLGVLAAFTYWARPGSFTPTNHPFYADVRPIYVTCLAWAPYVVAFFVSKALLADRDPKAIYAYVVLAMMVTGAGAVLYLNLLGWPKVWSPLLISGCVTLALSIAAVGVATIWGSDVAD